MLRTTMALAAMTAFLLLAGGAAAQPSVDFAFCKEKFVTNVAMWTCVKQQPAILNIQFVMSGGGLVATWVLWCEGYKPFSYTAIVGGTRLSIRVGPKDYRQLYRQMVKARICRFTIVIQAPSSSTAPRPLSFEPHWFSR
jgi:hypothetical protein